MGRMVRTRLSRVIRSAGFGVVVVGVVSLLVACSADEDVEAFCDLLGAQGELDRAMAEDAAAELATNPLRETVTKPYLEDLAEVAPDPVRDPVDRLRQAVLDRRDQTAQETLADPALQGDVAVIREFAHQHCEQPVVAWLDGVPAPADVPASAAESGDQAPTTEPDAAEEPEFGVPTVDVQPGTVTGADSMPDVAGLVGLVRCDTSSITVQYLQGGQPYTSRDAEITSLNTVACGNTSFNASPVVRQALSRELRYVAGTYETPEGGQGVGVVDIWDARLHRISADRQATDFNAPLLDDRWPAFDTAGDRLLFYDANEQQMLVAHPDDGWVPSPWDGASWLGSQGFITVPGQDLVLPRDDGSLRGYHPHPTGRWILQTGAQRSQLLDTSTPQDPDTWTGVDLGDPPCAVRGWVGGDRLLCLGHTDGPGSHGDVGLLQFDAACNSLSLRQLTDSPDRFTVEAAGSTAERQVMFTSRRGEDTGLYLIDVDDTEPIELQDSGAGGIGRMFWLEPHEGASTLDC